MAGRTAVSGACRRPDYRPGAGDGVQTGPAGRVNLRPDGHAIPGLSPVTTPTLSMTREDFP